MLAVIVILAIIALIATPIVLGIVDDTKESAQLRSAEFYLVGVQQAVMKENLRREGNFKPNECVITEEGNITEVELIYDNATIVKNEEGNLVYEGSENGAGANYGGIIYSLYYWLGSAYSTGDKMYSDPSMHVVAADDMYLSGTDHDVDWLYGIRPVVEISKSKIF